MSESAAKKRKTCIPETTDKKATVEEEVDLCLSCKVPCTDEESYEESSLKCDGCRQWIHIRCDHPKITDWQYNLLSVLDDQKVDFPWKCRQCVSKRSKEQRDDDYRPIRDVFPNLPCTICEDKKPVKGIRLVCPLCNRRTHVSCRNSFGKYTRGMIVREDRMFRYLDTGRPVSTSTECAKETTGEDHPKKSRHLLICDECAGMQAAEIRSKKESNEEQSQGSSNEEQSQGSSNVEPSQGSSNQEPSQGSSNQEPSQRSSNKEPSQGSSNEEPSQGSSNEEPSQGSSNEEPSQGSSNDSFLDSSNIPLDLSMGNRCPR